jgi:hypothetical protein
VRLFYFLDVFLGFGFTDELEVVCGVEGQELLAFDFWDASVKRVEDHGTGEIFEVVDQFPYADQGRPFVAFHIETLPSGERGQGVKTIF